MVMVDAPVGVVERVETVSVVVQVGLQLAGENVAVAPTGKPDAVKLTACVAPARSVAVTVFVTELPCTTDRAPPLESEKSNAGAFTVSEFEHVCVIISVPEVTVTDADLMPVSV